jgi:hypothetical protein
MVVVVIVVMVTSGNVNAPMVLKMVGAIPVVVQEIVSV